MEYQLKQTADGSSTLYLPALDEQYHSMNGAVTESKHVFIEKGYLFHPAPCPVVFEVGFGTGLNCLLTAVYSSKLKRPTTFYSVEKYPLEQDIINQLNYSTFIPEEFHSVFKAIHSCDWGTMVCISPWFNLYKIKTDLTTEKLAGLNTCDILYFDAFAPGKQPQMWTPEIFSLLYNITSPGGIFVTYSAKGEIRRRLTAAGYSMERLPGPPGKKEMLRGIKVGSRL